MYSRLPTTFVHKLICANKISKFQRALHTLKILCLFVLRSALCIPHRRIVFYNLHCTAYRAITIKTSHHDKCFVLPFGGSLAMAHKRCRIKIVLSKY